jgi:hypothetical protein
LPCAGARHRWVARRDHAARGVGGEMQKTYPAIAWKWESVAFVRAVITAA